MPSGLIGTAPIGSFTIGGVLCSGVPAYIGLFTDLEAETESVIGRQLYAGKWLPADGFMVNNVQILFPALQHETVDGWGVWTAVSGGVPIYTAPFEVELHHLYPGVTHGFEPGGLGVGIETLSPQTLTSLTHEDAAHTLKQLLPEGPVWEGPSFANLVRGASLEFSRIDDQATRLMDEAIPSTAYDLLSRWEAAVGLPDECTEELATDIASRRAAVVARLSESSAATVDNITAITESLGYTGVVVTRNLAEPFTAGSGSGSSLMGGPWYYAWEVATDQSTSNDELLMCLLERIKPAYSYLLFDLG